MAPPMNGPRFNEFIQSPTVRVIDDKGENIGVLTTQVAIARAAEVGLDLVEVSPNADPPVAKFLDVGKFKYEAQKKANLARKTQKTQEIKEIKMRPNIDDHDYDTKMKKVFDFIGDGDLGVQHTGIFALFIDHPHGRRLDELVEAGAIHGRRHRAAGHWGTYVA